MSTTAQQIDYVLVATDLLHHLHLGNEVSDFVVAVSLFQHLDGHHCLSGGAIQAKGLGLHHLTEGTLAQRFAQNKTIVRQIVSD